MNDKFEEYSREELLGVIGNLTRRKKFGLVWEEKPEKIVSMCAENLPVLNEVKSKAINSDSNMSTNLIIEGDNYHSLSVLNYTHGEKIDLIYIDPPYNTGSKDFIYNDSYVDREDTFRHSKWLSFMSKRLRIAKELLKDSGIIFVSIGEDEQAHLKLLMDSIFGEHNFIETFIWESIFRPSNLGKSVRRNSEYVLCYVKNKSDDFSLAQKSQEAQGEASLTQNNNKLRTLKFPENYVQVKLENGTYKKGKYGNIEMLDNLIVKGGLAIKEFRINGRLKWKQEYLDSEVEKNVTLIIKTKSFIPYYRKDYQETVLRPTKIIPREVVGDVLSANAELKRIFGDSVFDYPKPTSLIKYLTSICSLPDNAIILDFFAGSGTTGHAVMELNSLDGGNRKFILCTNNENGIAENVTYRRIKSVIEGYGSTNGIPAKVRYFQTDFIGKEVTDDQTRVKLVQRSQEIIAVREDTHDVIHTQENFTILENSNKLSAIVFDPDSIPELISTLNRLSPEKKLGIYVFSMSNDSYHQDFSGLDREYSLKPIPEGLLAVYRRIFDNRTKGLGE